MSPRLGLGRLRQRDWALIFIVLSIVLAAAWYWFMYRPSQERITALEDEIARLDVQIERGEAARRNLPDLRLAVAELEQDRRAFLSELPTESDVADLIEELRGSAADAGVQVNQIGRGGGQGDIQDVRPIGFQIATVGTFGETMSFLGTLENLQRFTRISQVSLSTSELIDDPALNANFGFTVYVFTGDDPGDPEGLP